MVDTVAVIMLFCYWSRDFVGSMVTTSERILEAFKSLSEIQP